MPTMFAEVNERKMLLIRGRFSLTKVFQLFEEKRNPKYLNNRQQKIGPTRKQFFLWAKIFFDEPLWDFFIFQSKNVAKSISLITPIEARLRELTS